MVFGYYASAKTFFPDNNPFAAFFRPAGGIFSKERGAL